MLFGKFLPRRASFVVMLLAGICFMALTVVNLGMPISDLLIQLLAITVLIILLAGSAFVVAILIRYVIQKNEDRYQLDENDSYVNKNESGVNKSHVNDEADDSIS